MTPRTQIRGRRLLTGTTAAALAAGVLAFVPATAQASAAAVTIEGGSISWGLKASFRTYLTNGAHGTITPTTPATDNGSQTVFPQATGTWSDSEADVGTKGAVRFRGHEDALDLTVSDPRIVTTGSSTQLVVDAVDSDGETHEDVAFATVKLTGAVTSDADSVTITNAPTTITAAGSALLSYRGSAFYPAGTTLDPVSAQWELAVTPKVAVSKTTFFADETATITVSGSGFDPDAAIGAQPPFKGTQSGYYVVFGTFADVWRPSENAPSTARKNTSQKWALPQPSLTTLQGFGGDTAAQGVLLNADGSFTTELTVSKAAIDAAATDPSLANYGIYTYAGGGAKVAAAETFTPVTFVKVPTAITAKTTTSVYGKGATVSVTVPQAGTVTIPGLGTKKASAAGVVSFAIARSTAAGTKRHTASFAPVEAETFASTSTSLTVKIAKANASKPTLKVSRKPTSKKKGTSVVRVKGVSGGAATTGKVKVKLTKGKKSKVVTVSLSKGKRTVTLPKLAKGTWTVRVAYYGNTNYAKRGYVKTGTIKVTQ